MIRNRALRFVLLVGIVLAIFVAVLFVRDENLFGPKRVLVHSTADARDDAGSARKSNPTAADLAVRGAQITALAPTPRGGPKAKQYVVLLGETVGPVEKRTRARDVVVRIYNKKPPPDERMIAEVKGLEAVLNFTTAPDVAAGFTGAEISSIELQKDVLVDYLDENGESASRMTTDELELAADRFHAPNRALVKQEGMEVEGNDWTYDQTTGVLEIQHDVRVEGDTFRLPKVSAPRAPGANDATRATPAESEVPAAGLQRQITSKGSLVYVPSADAQGRKRKRQSTDGPIIQGGLLTFRDQVHGSQADTTVDCDILEITLDSPPEPEPGAPATSDSPEIRKVVASGTPERPATIVDARGRFLGETLRLEKTESGDVFTLEGNARVEDAKLGDATAADEPPTVLSAFARSSIRLAPVPPDAPVPGATPDTPAPERIRIELREAAFLSSHGATPENDFRIEGESIDVLATRSLQDGAEKTELDSLVSRGNAVGLLADGRFTAQEIQVRPQPGGAGTFAITMFPDPHATFRSELDTGGERVVTIQTTDGNAEIHPPEQEGGSYVAAFTGNTDLRVTENDQLVTHLMADGSVTIEGASPAPAATDGSAAPEAKDSARSNRLVAEKNVRFDSEQQGVHGEGEHVELLPGENDSQRVLLLGAPALVRLRTETGEDNEIRARRIEFDPTTHVLTANGSVLAHLHNSMLEVAEAGAPAPASTTPGEPSTLRCEQLEVLLPATDPATGETSKNLVLDARGAVAYHDPAQLLDAAGSSLHYEQATGKVVLLGADDRDAQVTRLSPAAAGQAPDRVQITGPRIDMDQVTSELVCPSRGTVTLVRKATSGGSAVTERLTGSAEGPVTYADDRLILRKDVVIVFEQDGREERTLWSDIATVFFQPKERAATPAPGSDGPATTSPFGAVDRMLAQGRVRIEQTLPNKLKAGGDSAEWRPASTGDFIELRGARPRCWVETERDAQILHTEADWIRMNSVTQDIVAHRAVHDFREKKS